MTYRVVAANHAEASENRIHSDEVAQRYCFTGALVPGVAVFGYMSHEVTRVFGTSWLSGSVAEVRLIKPAYAGDRLAIDVTRQVGRRLDVECRNDAGVLLATLAVDAARTLPPVDARASIAGRTPDPPRQPIDWQAIHVDRPFAAFTWRPSIEENRIYANHVDDDSPDWREGILHPHLLQHMANVVLVRRFIMPAWVHVGTEMRFRRVLRAGDSIEIRTVPVEKWERKGHQFVKLYIAYAVDDRPAIEAFHTAIFSLAERRA
jgi:acyl dehydratase